MCFGRGLSPPGSGLELAVCLFGVDGRGEAFGGGRPLVQVINRGMRESAIGMMACAGQAVGRWILIIVFISTT